MKMKSKHVFWVGVLLAITFILGPNLLSFQQTANELYQAGVLKKSGEGNLEEAIALFQKIVDNFPDNRELASKALLQIGLCYNLLGEKKAEAAFRKLIADYPDQTNTVKIAREKLELLSRRTEDHDSVQKLTLREVYSPYEDSGPRGAPSPDGRYFAFEDWDRGGNLSLYNIKSKEVIPITSYEINDKSWCDNPIWSRDGIKIAYIYHSQNQTDEIHILRLTNKKNEFTYENSELIIFGIAGWSPDHQKLYVHIRHKNRDSSLGFISINSGLLTEIKQLGRTSPFLLSVSPDGKFLGYVFRDESGKTDIRAITTDGKETYILVENPGARLFGWTPAGNHILFTSSHNGKESIWLLPVKDGRPNGEPTKIHSTTGNFLRYGFTNSGALYFSESYWENDVYTASMNLDTGKILKAPEKIEKASLGHTRTPFWSQDGKFLGYIVEHGTNWNGPHSLKIRSLETGEIREWLLDFSPSPFTQLPRWTSDGKYILINGRKESAEGTGLYRIEVKTGHSNRITDKKGISAFSHDASLIYRVESIRTRNSQEIQSWLFLHSQDGKEKELIKGQVGTRMGSFSLSPNKKWLRFSMRKFNEQGNILSWNIMPAEGGENLDLSKKFEIIGPILWGPHENGIIFRRESEQPDKVDYWYISDFKKNIPPQKLELTMPGIRDISFHPDGQTIAFTGQPYTSKLWVMENYLPPKKEK